MVTTVKELKIDVSHVGAKKVRSALKQLLTQEGFTFHEITVDLKGGLLDKIEIHNSTLFFTDLHQLAKLTRQSDKKCWSYYIRKNQPHFISLIRSSKDENYADFIDDLVRFFDGRLSVVRIRENMDASVRKTLKNEIRKYIERHLSPDSLMEVSYIEKDKGYQVSFNDGVSGFVSLEEMGLEEYEEQLMIDRPAIEEMGKAIELFSHEGELFEIDALAVKTLLSKPEHEVVNEQSKETATQVGERIRSVRKKESLTQQELSQNTGIDQAIISKIENGKHIPRYDTLKRIADGMGISVSRLVGG